MSVWELVFLKSREFNRLLANDILEERRNGLFKSIKEFLERLKNSKNISLSSMKLN